jgi:hypothetical protein
MTTDADERTMFRWRNLALLGLSFVAVCSLVPLAGRKAAAAVLILGAVVFMAGIATFVVANLIIVSLVWRVREEKPDLRDGMILPVLGLFDARFRFLDGPNVDYLSNRFGDRYLRARKAVYFGLSITLLGALGTVVSLVYLLMRYPD